MRQTRRPAPPARRPGPGRITALALLLTAHGGCGAEAYVSDHQAVSPPLSVVLAWWTLEPSVILGLALAGLVYAYGLRELRRHLGRQPAMGWQPVYFWVGLATLAIALLSPIDALGDYLLWAHMLQHFLLAVLAPPLLLLGLPRQLLLLALPRRWMRRALGWITQPLLTWLVYHAVLALWLIPGPYEAALHDQPLHILQHLTYLWSGLLFWWNVVSPLPSVGHLGYPVRLLYLIAASIMHLAYAVPIGLADHVLYPTYLTVPRLWGSTPMGDQALGAVIMGSMDFIYWMAVIIVFYRWTAPQGERRPA